SWGWTDPQDGKEYALVGLEGATAFVDISDPVNPVYLGKLPTHTNFSTWRDLKVHNDYVFIVSEASGHGMQIFDLTHLRNVTNPPVTFTEDAHYSGFSSAHNLVINEDTGYAYAVGTNTFSGGTHFVNIQDPLNPVAAGGFGGDGYVHDAQVVSYVGPDSDYAGSEILIASSGSMEWVSIVDVTNKTSPQSIATMNYTNSGYTHQGWFTDDHRYFLLGDEFDEANNGFNTRTIVFDLLDLDNPQHHLDFFGTTPATDHNGYVVGNNYYLSNYSAGLRVIDITDIASGNLAETGFFDTYGSNNNANYDGVWNVYPYFGSGNIMINDRSEGFFIVKASAPDTIDPVAVCQNFTAELDENGQVIVSGDDVDGGSSDNSGFFTITLSQNTFDCSHLGPNTVTVTVTDPAGNTDTCTSVITVVDVTGPVFDCPANQSAEYNEGDEFYTLPDYVASGDVSATDNCTASLVISQDPVAGTQLTEGVYPISFEATDDEGNSETCTFNLNVVEILGVDDFTQALNLVIFPNPSYGTITITSDSQNLKSISISDISGKLILAFSEVNSNSETLDISAFSKGIYFVNINNTITKKIIKQ
ncbi:MAG: choice-of-anchor B family protein, partial [Bacteroidia bacterium]|nr:choice-of-anchor B family protein [Bacteroidia bacterium]